MSWLDRLPWRRQTVQFEENNNSTDADYESYDLLDAADVTSADHAGVDKKMLAAVNMTGAFGRERHLELLKERIAQVKSGQNRALILMGEDGSGQSFFLNRLQALGREWGVTVLDSKCDERDQTNPYRPFFNALGLAVNSNGQVIRAREVGLEGDTVSSIVQGVLSIAPIVSLAVPGSALVMVGVPLALQLRQVIFEKRKYAQQSQYVRATPNYQFIRRAVEEIHQQRRRPVVLIIDDFNLASPTTHELIDHLLDTPAQLLIVLGWDLGLPNPTRNLSRLETILPEEMQKTVRRGAGEVDFLEPLPPKKSLGLIEQLDPDRRIPNDLRQRIAELSRGYPVTILTAVRYLHNGGAPNLFWDTRVGADSTSSSRILIATMTQNIFGKLSKRARNLVQAAAMMGRSFPYRLLTLPRLIYHFRLGKGERVVLRTLSRLTRAGTILTLDPADPDYVRFANDFVYTYVVRRTPRLVRRVDHLRIAQAWDKDQGSLPSRFSQAIAGHYKAGGDLEAALRHYERAAEFWTGNDLYRDAITCSKRALKLLDQLPDPEAQREARVTSLVNLAFCYEQLNDPRRARRYYHDALALVPRDRKRLAELNGHLGYLAYQTGDFRTAREHLDRADAIYRELDDLDGRLQVGLYRARLFNQVRDFGQVLDVLGEAVSLAEAAGKASDLDLFYQELGLAQGRLSQWAEADEYLRKGLALAEARGDQASLAQGYHFLGRVESWHQHPEAVDYLKEAIALLDGGRRDERMYAQILNTLADTYQRLSRPDEALATFQQAIPLMERLGDRFGLGIAYGGLGRLLSTQWRFEEAITYLLKDIDLLAEQAAENASVINQLLNQVAAAYARIGQREPALAAHERAMQAITDIGDTRARDTSLGFTHMQLAEVLGETYQGEDDLQRGRTALAQARRYLTSPRLKPYLDFVEARLARRAGEDDQARALLDGCLNNPDVPIADAEKAMMWLEAGRVAQAQGHTALVHAALEQVTTLAAKLGNTRLADVAAKELAPGMELPQADELPKTPELAGTNGLTQGEEVSHVSSPAG